MKANEKIKVVLVDDHVLLRRGLASLVNSFGEYQVVCEGDDGLDLQKQIGKNDPPDLALLDISMPKMDGFATAQWLKETYPLVKVMALSMYDSENSVIRMFRAGACGYILKDCEPAELKTALDSVMKKGYYYSELVTGKLIHSINQMEENADLRKLSHLSKNELEYLRYACTEMTHKEIADKMGLSPRTIDGYRDTLLRKLDLKSRVGLVMYAIKNGIVQV